MSGRDVEPAAVLVVEDDDHLRKLLEEELTDAGHAVRAARTAEQAEDRLTAEPADLIVCDLRLPGRDGLELLRRTRVRDDAPTFIVITAFGTVAQAVQCLKEGAHDFLTKPLDLDHLRLTVERALESRRLSREVARLRRALGDGGFHGMLGRSEPMRRLFRRIRVIGPGEGPVLIHGESGTGKELVARAIHAESPRRDATFVAVNCAGVPAELLESEFFGHARGAFTGATSSRAGLFAEADGGTLLLDEITEMPLGLQAKLLRVLQQGTVRRVGDDRERAVDVRIVASTNRDPASARADDLLRDDLYYRLQTFMLEVPALRDRDGDIERLAWHFVRGYAARLDKSVNAIDPEALELLRKYPFPGNVRELENVLEHAVTFCSGDTLGVAHLPARLRQAGAAPDRPAAADGSPPDDAASGFALHGEIRPLAEVERRYIRHVLGRVDGNKRRAAALLGIGRRTLYRKLDGGGETPAAG
ncbi:MAG: sigma-54-dependent transcriptional regulator [Gemmatimonadota bacterium]